jgi:hypothetical protein
MPTNPMNFIQMIIKGGGNPQQIVMNMMEEKIKTSSNPLLANLYELAKNNQTGEIEKVARNMFKEQGKDFDKEFNSFKKFFGL